MYLVRCFNPPALAVTSCGVFSAGVAPAKFKNQENILADIAEALAERIHCDG